EDMAAYGFPLARAQSDDAHPFRGNRSQQHFISIAPSGQLVGRKVEHAALRRDPLGSAIEWHEPVAIRAHGGRQTCSGVRGPEPEAMNDDRRDQHASISGSHRTTPDLVSFAFARDGN